MASASPSKPTSSRSCVEAKATGERSLVEPVGDVRAHAQVGKERRRLAYEGDTALARIHGSLGGDAQATLAGSVDEAAVEADPTLLEPDRAGDRLEAGGLARTGRPEERETLSRSKKELSGHVEAPAADDEVGLEQRRCRHRSTLTTTGTVLRPRARALQSRAISGKGSAATMSRRAKTRDVLRPLAMKVWSIAMGRPAGL